MGDCDATNVAHTNERTAVSFRILCVDKMLDSFLTQEYALYGKKKAPWDTVLFQVLVWHRAAGQDCGVRERNEKLVMAQLWRIPIGNGESRETTDYNDVREYLREQKALRTAPKAAVAKPSVSPPKDLVPPRVTSLGR